MINNKKGILALSPLIMFIGFYLTLSLVAGDFSKVPITVAFMLTSIYAVCISGGHTLQQRIDIYSRGAGSSRLLLMLWIYVLAGAFAASAKAMGCIDATINMTLQLVPSSMLLPGLFAAACFISLSIGTSVGTVVALAPVAAGIANTAGISVPMTVAVVVGGAYFGDNLSFISDTTVVATQTQGCRMSDKFWVNLQIVAPAALIVLIIYCFMGSETPQIAPSAPVDYIRIIPYLAVLVFALMGLNVMAILSLGILLCSVIGIAVGAYNFYGLLDALGKGIASMGELVIIAMMAGGILEIITEMGGITYLIDRLTKHVHTKRGAELSIAGMVSMVNLCTANNTIAILTVGDISRRIGNQFGVDKRKAASILDTFSCMVQGIIPYGVQMLLAAGLAHISPMAIIPYLYYPMAIGVTALGAIILRYPKKYC